MLQLKIPKAELKDLIKKMALPTGKSEYIFDVIAPEITPDGRLEWIGKTKNITVWVRAKGLDVSGSDEPIIIAIKVKEIMNKLTLLKIKKDIKITHNTDTGEDIFTVQDDKQKRTLRFPSVPLEEAKERHTVFPNKIDTDGVIVSFDGVKPDCYVACDVSLLKELVKNTEKVMGKKKMNEIPNIYHIVFDGDNGMLRAIAGDYTKRENKTVTDEVYYTSIKGNGIVHYAMGFPEVMSVLDGEVELYAFEGGPLWIVQDSDTMRLRYLIPPAKFEN